MKPESIFVRKNYYVEKIDMKMVATPARGGLYRATSARDVERALTDGTQQDEVFVRISTKTKWTPLPRAGYMRLSEVGSKLFIEMVEMGKEAFDKLPEFDGW